MENGSPNQEDGPQKKWKWRVTRTGRVADALREDITSGVFRSNQKLPTFDELTLKYGVSRFTIQSVVNQLKKEGFIYGIPRSGLYVAEAPPHLNCVGLVFSTAPGKTDWPRFCALAKDAVSRLESASGYRIRTYHNVDGLNPSPESKALKGDIMQRRLAAVITLLDATKIVETPLFQDLQIPVYSLFSLSRQFKLPAGVSTLEPSYELFVQQSLGKFKLHGCRRLAWLSIPPIRHDQGYFEESGFKTKPHWLLQLPRTTDDHVHAIVSLLFDQPASKRPDALMLADENLVPGALRALADMGLKPGRDLEIVAHMNWPSHRKDLDPAISWLGYDVEEALGFALQQIQASGEASRGAHHRMKPRFKP
ncbi:MAG: GntR family transcriptional regulator [Verrucomicrobiota bacterium]